MARVLVVGGAGYVGSCVTAWLIDRGHDIWVLDDLSTGHRELLLRKAGFIQCRAGDSAKVRDFLSHHHPDCVMHFAAKCLVAESVEKPDLYYENNVIETRKLLETMLEAEVRNFVFSSTCAIFGDPGENSIHENTKKNPLNPYGQTKLQVEEILAEFAQTRGLRSAALRYFNASGADFKLRVGEWHDPETHLIPKTIQATLRNEAVQVHGNDYLTTDGTCIRDYVHVSDLAAAHEAAMNLLLDRQKEASAVGAFEAFNLGSENGYSVLEIISTCEKITGKSIKVAFGPRRPGDPPRLVADSTQAKSVLNFRPMGLEPIVRSAWNWERKRGGLLRKAVFLDRDGTLNEDPGYLNDPSQLCLLPGVGESLAELRNNGFLLVVISNQSGVSRGLIAPTDLSLIHDRMDDLLSKWSVRIDHYGICTHRPEDSCECRKPKPKLLIDAIQALGIDPASSFMIGDKGSDLEAGRAIGCRGAILVRTGEGSTTEKSLEKGKADFIGDSLRSAVRWILNPKNEEL